MFNFSWISFVNRMIFSCAIILTFFVSRKLFFVIIIDQTWKLLLINTFVIVTFVVVSKFRLIVTTICWFFRRCSNNVEKTFSWISLSIFSIRTTITRFVSLLTNFRKNDITCCHGFNTWYAHIIYHTWYAHIIYRFKRLAGSRSFILKY